MATIGEMLVRVGLDTKEFNANMQSLQQSISGLGTNLTQVGTALSIGITAPIVAFGTAAVLSAANLDSLKRGLEAVSPSAGFAAVQLGQLGEVAKLPGLSFDDAVQGQVRLQAAGLSASLATDALRAFGNAIATVGGTSADLDGVSRALQQIANKSKISAEEINQLAERVPQIRQIMQAVYGTADTEELQKRGVDPIQFIRDITAELLKLPPVSSGVKNEFENMSDAMKLVSAEIGNALLPYVQVLVPQLLTFLEHIKGLAVGFQALPTPIQNTVVATVAFGVALGPVLFAVGSLITAVTRIGTLLGSLGVSFGAVNATAVATAAAFSGLVAVVAWPGLSLVNEEWRKLKEEVGGVSGSFVTLYNAYIQNIHTPLNELFGIVQLNKKETSAFGSAISDTAGKMANMAGSVIAWLTPLGPLASAIEQVRTKVAELKAQLGPTQKDLEGVRKEITDGAREQAAAAMQTMGITTATGELSKEYKEAQAKARQHRLEEEARAKALKNVKEETIKVGEVTKELDVHFKVIEADAALYRKELEEQEKKYIAAGVAAARYGGDITDLADDAEVLNAKIVEQGRELQDVSDIKFPKYIGQVQEASVKTGDLNSALSALGVTSASEYNKIAADAKAAYEVVAGSNLSSDWEKNTALLKALEAQRAAMVANGEIIPAEMQKQIDALEATTSDPNTGLAKVTSQFRDFGAEVSTIVTNLAQDIGKSLFDGETSFKEKGIQALKDIGAAAVSQFVQPFLNALTGPEGLITKGLNVLISKLSEAFGLTGAFFGVGSSVAGGAAGAAGAAGSAIGSAGGAAGSATSAASGAISSVTGIVGAIGSIGTMISGIVSNFQFAAMNKSLDLIETATRRVDIATTQNGDWNLLLNTGYAREYLGYLVDDLRGSGVNVKSMLSDISGNTFWTLKKAEGWDGTWTALFREMTDSTFWTLKKIEGWDGWIEMSIRSMESSLAAIKMQSWNPTVNVYLDSVLVQQAIGADAQLQNV